MNRDFLRREREIKQRVTPLVPETLPLPTPSRRLCFSPSSPFSPFSPCWPFHPSQSIFTPRNFSLAFSFLLLLLLTLSISISFSLSSFLFFLTLSQPIPLLPGSLPPYPETTPGVDASRVVATGSERSNVPGMLRIRLHVCQQVCVVHALSHHVYGYAFSSFQDR